MGCHLQQEGGPHIVQNDAVSEYAIMYGGGHTLHSGHRHATKRDGVGISENKLDGSQVRNCFGFRKKLVGIIIHSEFWKYYLKIGSSIDVSELEHGTDLVLHGGHGERHVLALAPHEILRSAFDSANINVAQVGNFGRAQPRSADSPDHVQIWSEARNGERSSVQALGPGA
jgi:hypothetical protein